MLRVVFGTPETPLDADEPHPAVRASRPTQPSVPSRFAADMSSFVSRPALVAPGPGVVRPHGGTPPGGVSQSARKGSVADSVPYDPTRTQAPLTQGSVKIKILTVNMLI